MPEGEAATSHLTFDVAATDDSIEVLQADVRNTDVESSNSKETPSVTTTDESDVED